MVPVHSWSGVAEAYRHSFGTLCEGTVERLLVDTSGTRHLDVGCGSGTLAARAAALGRQVVAVDSDPDMVALAEAVVPGQVVEASLPELPFSDDEYDVVTANFVINHVPDPRAAMRELARVARPGGQVAATIWPAQGSAWRTLVTDAFEAAEVVPVPVPFLSAEADFERSVGGLRGLAETAGLQVVDATLVEWEWTVTVDALWRGITSGIATVGQQYLAQAPAVRTAAEAAFRSAAEARANDGVLRLPSAAAYVLATA